MHQTTLTDLPNKTDDQLKKAYETQTKICEDALDQLKPKSYAKNHRLARQAHSCMRIISNEISERTSMNSDDYSDHDRLENIIYQTAIRRQKFAHGQFHGQNREDIDKVKQMLLDCLEEGISGPSQRDVIAKIGGSFSNVTDIISAARWQVANDAYANQRAKRRRST